MSNVSPEKARKLLRGTIPGPWAFDPEPSIYPIESADGRSVVFQAEDADMGPFPGIRDQDGHFIAAAPDMAQTIANMVEEWGAEYGDPATGLRHASWFEWREEAQEELDHLRANPYNQSPRLIRRYVTKPETVDED